MRAAIYSRISSDRSGEALGVQRQLDLCRKLATEREWQVTNEFQDNDISAFGNKVRPGYRALLAAMETGEVDVVITYAQDRLFRRLKDLVPFMEVAGSRHVNVVTVQAGELDLSSASGRMTAAIIGSVAQHESEQKAERIAAQKLANAKAGRPNGSMRSFGYSSDGEIIETEAEVIRDLARRLLAGESGRSLANELNERQVPTVRGGTWRTTGINQLLVSAKLSGQREHTPVGSDHLKRARAWGMGEIVADAVWPAILTKADTARIRQMLADPARKTVKPGQQLLTALLLCGSCGKSLNSHADRKSGRRYMCIKVPGTGKCGTRSVVGDKADELVTAVVMEAIYGGGPPGRFSAPPPAGVPPTAQKEADRLGRELKKLAFAYAGDEVSEMEYEDQRTRLRERQRAVLRTAAQLSPTAALSALPETMGELGAVWPDWNVDKRRAVLRAALVSVVLGPVEKRGRPTFDNGRFTFNWQNGV